MTDPSPPPPRLRDVVPLWKLALVVTPAILFAFTAGLIMGLRAVCP